MYNKITNPVNGDIYNINSINGKNILKNYLSILVGSSYPESTKYDRVTRSVIHPKSLQIRSRNSSGIIKNLSSKFNKVYEEEYSEYNQSKKEIKNAIKELNNNNQNTEKSLKRLKISIIRSEEKFKSLINKSKKETKFFNDAKEILYKKTMEYIKYIKKIVMIQNRQRTRKAKKAKKAKKTKKARTERINQIIKGTHIV